MSFKILNTRFTPVYEIDAFESIVWSDRYIECGDFEIYTTVTEELQQYMDVGRYVMNTDDYDPETQLTELMIIETIEIESTYEDGPKMKITGRNLKSLLDRRIVWDRTVYFTGYKVGKAIANIINNNFGYNPTQSAEANDPARRCTAPYFGVPASSAIYTHDAELLNDVDLTGMQVLDAVEQLCQQYDIGYTIMARLDQNNPYNTRFEFVPLMPVDRTYDQTAVPPVVFSPSLGNIVKTSYVRTIVPEKTVVLVADEGDEEDRITTTVYASADDGIDRKEAYVSVSNLDWEGDRQKYISLMKQQGEAELLKCKMMTGLDGETDNAFGYVYGKDYKMGDIVEFQNEFGYSGKVRLVEMITSITASGRIMTPSFTSI